MIVVRQTTYAWHIGTHGANIEYTTGIANRSQC